MTSEPINSVGDGTFGLKKTLPAGTYTFEFTDACNKKASVTQVITGYNDAAELAVGVKASCNVGLSNLTLSNPTGRFDSISIIDAPTTYSGPMTLTTPESDGSFSLLNVPDGNYKFIGYYTCDGVAKQSTNTTVVEGLHETNSLSIIPLCGAYEINGTFTSNVDGQLFIQRYNKTDGSWENVTGVNFDQVMIDSSNGRTISFTHRVINDTTSPAQLRIVMSDANRCLRVLKEFEIDYSGAIVKPYVFSCGGNKITLGVTATGVGPFTYSIVKQNGNPVNISPTSVSNVLPYGAVFTGLDVGVYQIQVTDNCGNTKLVDVAGDVVQTPIIKAANMCDGANGTLSIDQISFMDITWTKDGGPIPASVTTSNDGYTLNFTPYDKATQKGTYTATLSLKNATGCAPIVVSYILSDTNDTAPEAGTGRTVYIDTNTLTGPLNLFNYLTGPYDTNGYWVETSFPESGLLIGNIWNGQTITEGTYTFNYYVNGTCSGMDFTTVTIIISNLEVKPDSGSGYFGEAFTAVDNVLANDNVSNVVPVIGTNPGQVTISEAGTWPAGIHLDTTTGEVRVDDTVTLSHYVVDYTVCINATEPLSCQTTSVTIDLTTAPYCYNPNSNFGVANPTQHGITLLKRAGVNEDNWPMLRGSAHTVLESNTKGFVVTRMTSDPAATSADPKLSKITTPQEGMMVYDTYAKCFKIFSGGAWKCFSKPGCPDR